MCWHCALQGSHAWWRSLVCRAGAGSGFARSVSWSSPSMRTLPGQQQWHQLAREAALRGKRVAVLPPEAYGGCKDVSEAWAAGGLAGGVGLAVPEHLREIWEERAALMAVDGGLPRAAAERLAWVGLQPPREV